VEAYNKQYRGIASNDPEPLQGKPIHKCKVPSCLMSTLDLHAALLKCSKIAKKTAWKNELPT
jgi:hypothetical protein